LEYEAKGETLTPPPGCYTKKRIAKGMIDLLVNEERYQELQMMEAERNPQRRRPQGKRPPEGRLRSRKLLRPLEYRCRQNCR
jgi:hypothetical protein